MFAQHQMTDKHSYEAAQHIQAFRGGGDKNWAEGTWRLDLILTQGQSQSQFANAWNFNLVSFQLVSCVPSLGLKVLKHTLEKCLWFK